MTTARQLARHGDQPKQTFAQLRREALPFCDAVARFAQALRDPFAPGAGDVIARAQWEKFRTDEWCASIQYAGDALRDGADDVELARLRAARELEAREDAEQQVALGIAEARIERDTAERINDAASTLVEFALHGSQRRAPWLPNSARPLTVNERIILMERLAAALHLEVRVGEAKS